MYSQKNLMRQHFLFAAFNSFYGLKQAPKVWFEKLRTKNFSSGFKQSQSDHSLFLDTFTAVTVLLVYMNDILISGNATVGVQKLQQTL